MNSNLKKRWFYLAIGVISMFFAGIVYAWSILKAPLAQEFGWTASELAINFTLTMSFFCIGGFLGSKLVARIGVMLTVILSGVLSGLGFVLMSMVNTVMLLYVTYALMAGLGIGIAYIVIISTVNAWFPDKKGLSSGCLMMGFGASSLLLGNLANALFAIPSIGWKTTYICLGLATGTMLVIAGLLIRRPDATVELPKTKATLTVRKEKFDQKDYSPVQMICRPTFWCAFVLLVCLTAVGNTVISFARDLAMSIGAQVSLATTLVGVLAVCNGLGRVITGAIFDAFGRRITMTVATILVVVAASVTLMAVVMGSLTLCIIGLCITGFSYGTSPTVASVFVTSFYGPKYFSTNFSIINFNLMCASFVATITSKLYLSSGGYVVPFVLLLILAATTLVLNLLIKKP